MIITCQKCSTSYHLDETLLKPEGTKVRCTVCKTIFKAYPPIEASLEHKQDYLTFSQNEAESQIDSSLDRSDKMDFSDDLAKALEQNLYDSDFDDDGEFNRLPSNLIHEIEEEEDGLSFDEAIFEDSFEESDDAFQESSNEGTFEEDNFDISDSTFDLSDDEDNITEKDEIEPEIEPEDLRLSPEDLDLVKGYQSNSYRTEDESNLEPNSQEKKNAEFGSDIAYEDDSVSLSEDDLDLGISMATQAIEEVQETTPDFDDEDHIISQAKEDKVDDFEKDQDKNNQQIDIAAELDLEFGSELNEEGSEPAFHEGLDMELSLDDSEPMPAKTNDDNDSEELTLGLDFEEVYEAEELFDDNVQNEDTNTIKTDTELEAIPANQEDFDIDVNFEDNLDDQTPKEDFNLSIDKDDDIDLNLDPDGIVGIEDEIESTVVEGDGEDFDLDINFEDNLGEQTPKEDFDLSIVKDDDLDLNLDFDDIESIEDGTESSTGSESTMLEDDDLNLNLDLGEIENEIESSSDSESTMAEDDDLELSLDFDSIEEMEESEEDLDLTLTKDEDFDLNLDFDNNEDKEKTDQDLDLTVAKDEDFDLDLDFDSSEDEEKIDEDLDLTLVKDDDFNLDFDIEDSKDESQSEDSEGGLDFKLDLDDTLENNGESSHSNIDKDFKLDSDTNESAEKMSGSDDLDLSDLQELLDTDQANQSKHNQTIGTEAVDDFDFSDLENALENDSENQTDENLADDEDLELDLDFSSNSAESNENKTEDEFSTELDLSEFEYIADSDEKSPADDHFDTGDMELEFQIDEHSPNDQQLDHAKALNESKSTIAPQTVLDDTDDKTTMFKDTHLPESEEDEFDEHSLPAKKRSTSKALIYLFIFALLLGASYFTYVLLSSINIQIPILSDYLNPKTEDPGNLKLSTDNINSKFIDNSSAGRMFVITGKIKSEYDKPRRFVRITGKLFTKGKKLAKTEVVYGGNVVSDDELASSNITTIKKHLADRFGGNNTQNSIIQPGKMIPFMVIFSALPKEQLEEFTIEVDQSREIN